MNRTRYKYTQIKAELVRGASTIVLAVNESYIKIHNGTHTSYIAVGSTEVTNFGDLWTNVGAYGGVRRGGRPLYLQ